MVLFQRKTPWVRWAVALFLGAAGCWSLRASTTPALEEILQKALARAQQAETGTNPRDYTYTKVSVIEELDPSGKIKEHKEKVYQVFFQGGSTHVKLLEVNGRPPGHADLKQQSENDMNLRQLLGQPKSAQGDNRESFLTPELVARFDFHLLGQTVIEGRPAYRLAFQPKNPPPPTHRLVDKFLDRISGTIWIDAAEYEVARAEVQLRSQVDLLGGMIGCLKKLAYTLTRTRVADGVWLNSYSSADLEGRKLLDSLRIKTKSRSSNFRPLPMNS